MWCRACCASPSATLPPRALGIAIGIPVGASRNLRNDARAGARIPARHSAAGPGSGADPVRRHRRRDEDRWSSCSAASGRCCSIRSPACARSTRCSRTSCAAIASAASARLWHFVLPGASPQIFTGLRQSLSIGVILMVVSEMFAASERHRLRAGAISAHLRDSGNVERHHSARPDRHRAVADLPRGRSVAAGLVSRLAADAAGRLIMSETCDGSAPNRAPMLEVKKLRKVYDGGEPHRRGDPRRQLSGSGRASWSALSARRAPARPRCSNASPACWRRPRAA